MIKPLAILRFPNEAPPVTDNTPMVAWPLTVSPAEEIFPVDVILPALTVVEVNTPPIVAPAPVVRLVVTDKLLIVD